MKLAVNVEKNFFDIPLNGQLLSVKKAGFDGVFFDWSDSDEFTDNVNFARDIGLEIASIHAPFDSVCDMWTEEKPPIFYKLLRCIHECGSLGIKTLVCHVYIGLDTVAKTAKFKYLVLSYNSEGIMPQEEIIKILEQYGKVTLEQFEYARFKSNNNGLAKTKKTVFEQLYILEK